MSDSKQVPLLSDAIAAALPLGIPQWHGTYIAVNDAHVMCACALTQAMFGAGFLSLDDAREYAYGNKGIIMFDALIPHEWKRDVDAPYVTRANNIFGMVVSLNDTYGFTLAQIVDTLRYVGA